MERLFSDIVCLNARFPAKENQGFKELSGKPDGSFIFLGGLRAYMTIKVSHFPKDKTILFLFTKKSGV